MPCRAETSLDPKRIRREPVGRIAIAAAFGAVLACAMSACGESEKCEEGLCPVGTTCDEKTGECVDDAGLKPTETSIFGAFSAVAMPGLTQGFVGWVPERESLAYIEHDGAARRTVYIAGPAVDPKLPASGRISAAHAQANGRVHVAYLTDTGELWYATRSDGTWSRERVVTVSAGVAGESLSVAVWEGEPVIAFDDAHSGRLGFVRRGEKGWANEWIVPPSGHIDASFADLGGRIAISTFQTSIAVAAYESVGRDLVVATRNAGSWQATVVAGQDPSTGKQTSDVGLPCALARGLGGQLVVAFRDATHNTVVVARSKSGPTTFTTVTDGRHVVSSLGVTRHRLVGTAVSLAMLADGRLAVAFQDASRMRVGFARESADGNFDVGFAPYNNRPQVGPRVVAKLDGGAFVSWLELRAGASKPSGVIATWNAGPGSTLP